MPFYHEGIGRSDEGEGREGQEGGVDEWTGVVEEVSFDVLGAEDRGAVGGEGLAEGVQADGDAVFEREGRGQAAA